VAGDGGEEHVEQGVDDGDEDHEDNENNGQGQGEKGMIVYPASQIIVVIINLPITLYLTAGKMLS
jgi:hypothetical protein